KERDAEIEPQIKNKTDARAWRSAFRQAGIEESQALAALDAHKNRHRWQRSYGSHCDRRKRSRVSRSAVTSEACPTPRLGQWFYRAGRQVDLGAGTFVGPLSGRPEAPHCLATRPWLPLTPLRPHRYRRFVHQIHGKQKA